MKNMSKEQKKKFLLPVLALLAIGLVTGGLLTYFNTVEQDIEVKQGLLVDNQSYKDPITESSTVFSNTGALKLSSHSLNNNANDSSNVQLVRTNCTANVSPNSCSSIDTAYFESSESLKVDGQHQELVSDLAYNSSSDHIEFAVDGKTQGYILALDTNADGQYNFQLDIASQNPDYWLFNESSSINWTHKDEYRYSDPNPTWKNNGGQEFNGVSFRKSGGTLTVEVNSSEFGEAFRYMIEDTNDGETTFVNKSSGDTSPLRLFAYDSSEDLVGKETPTMSVPSKGSQDFTILNNYPMGTTPANYTLEHGVKLA